MTGQHRDYGGLLVRARPGWLTACGLLLAFVLVLVLVLVRGEPRVWGDQGVWLSVAARTLDGDRLYADVIDNKDPLFFYSYAGALWVGGWRAPFALDGLWLAISAIFMALMLRELRAGLPAVGAGLFLYPLALTAAWYDPGATMLAALSLAPVSAWFWLRGRFAVSGVAVAVAMLFKLNLVLVVTAPLAALLLLGTFERSRGRQLLGATAGLAATLGGAALFLGLRGELRAYLDVISYNVYYSDAGLVSLGERKGIPGHAAIAREYMLAAGKWQAPAAVAVCGLFLVMVAVTWRRYGRELQMLSGVAVAALLATTITAALTVLFGEHLQMFSYAAALVGATFVAAASKAFGRRAGASAAVACVAFAAWSSVKHEDLAHLSLRTWTAPQLSVPGLALEQARIAGFDGVARVPYMVFGRNTDDGHAAFVGGQLDLACRWFHQYPFYRDEQFTETLDCARRKRPLLVLVTQSFYDPMPGEPRWESFVSKARALLAADYELVNELGTAQVWKRR